AMAFNIGMLVFFKYCNFCGGSVGILLNLIGWPVHWVDLNILLPVGISFYTFESMSYTIDVYRGLIPAEKRWHRFAFFVSYFPHLIAGPILRPREFLPQLDQKPWIDLATFEEALYLIAKGLIKKIVLADLLGTFADKAFNHPEQVDCLAAWTGVLAFSFQIYYDFSGYTDLALGCARLMGFKLPENFNRPYVALSITDFWRRWHMTLSSWLRDYLYIPLGGSRMPTVLGVYRNLMITMVLGGLWHGAAWHFVLWGFLQGSFLVCERMLGWGTTQAGPPRLLDMGRRVLVFAGVTGSWLVFRCEDFGRMGCLCTTLMGSSVPGVAT